MTIRISSVRRVLRAGVAATASAVALGALSGGALAQSAAPQGDLKRAQGKVSMCIGCHGIPAYRTAYPEVYHVPMIGGQSAGYIVSALKAYAAGERNHATMRAIAAQLSDQDMADLAAYYANQKGR